MTMAHILFFFFEIVQARGARSSLCIVIWPRGGAVSYLDFTKCPSLLEARGEFTGVEEMGWNGMMMM